MFLLRYGMRTIFHTILETRAEVLRICIKLARFSVRIHEAVSVESHMTCNLYYDWPSVTVVG
jgi:hypothetical protein